MGFNLAFKGLKSSTYFEHYPAHLQEVYVVIVHMQPLVSSLSAGDCPVHLCIKFEINHGYTTMHGQPNIKNYSLQYALNVFSEKR